MNKDQANNFRKRLEKLREADQEQIEAITAGLQTSLQDSLEELSVYDNHPGDIGDATFEREKDLGFKQFYEERIAKIEEALQAINRGEYGNCKSCGAPIDIKRLEAVPYTDLCFACKNNEEKQKHELQPRPPEEDIMRMSFCGKLKGRDETGFDREDAWQAVARYGTSNSPADLGSVTDYNDVYYNSQEENGAVEDYENIPVYKDEDGMNYRDFRGRNH